MRARRALLLGASTLVATAGWAQEPEEAYFLWLLLGRPARA
ncbi:hypothetical protein [Tropicimonas aquimaris]|uniref:Uncharacterized protein n=1 Tax=Tropicimonas aquimaris TaxID=914152 RepID=A0ABW3IXP1_9RHOB